MKYLVKKHALVIILYLLVTFIMTLPASLQINSSLIGTGGDPWQTIWRFEDRWSDAKQAIAANNTFDYIKQEFGGGEPRLVNHSVWPWMWTHVLFGQPTGYNLTWLLSFALSGYAMYLLSSYLLQKRPPSAAKTSQSEIIANAPAFLAGLAYMLLPFHVAHSFGHFGAMQTGWLPLLLLSTFLFIKKPTLPRSIFLTLLLTIQAWTEHHYLLWYVFFAVIYLFFYPRKVKNLLTRKRGLLYTVLTVALLVATVVLPYWPTFKLATKPNSPISLGQEQLIRFSADPFSYFVPASFHPVWGSASEKLFTRHFTGNMQESILFLGLLPLLLVFFYHQKIPKKQKYFWFTTAGIFWLISLGPRLHLLGHITPIVLPYALIDQLPIIDAVRTVSRAAIIVNISWMVLLAWVFKTQIYRLNSVIIIAAILIIELMFWPLPSMSAKMPQVYSKLQNTPGQTLIEIPAATNYTIASRSLYGSKIHKKDLINNIALERAHGPKAYRETKSMPALRQLLYLRTSHILAGRDDFLRQDMAETLHDTMQWLNTRHVIVHPDSLSDTQQEAVNRLLQEQAKLNKQVIQDTWLFTADIDYDHDGIFASRDDGWLHVALDKKIDKVTTEIKDKASLTVYNANKNNKTIQITWQITPQDSENLQINSPADTEYGYNKDNNLATLKVKLQQDKTKIQFQNISPDNIRLVGPTLKTIEK